VPSDIGQSLPVACSGSYFVVVGTGHLVGRRGIISLLKQRGIELQPL
jgi:uncharacterized protein YbaP (TraB family)